MATSGGERKSGRKARSYNRTTLKGTPSKTESFSRRSPKQKSKSSGGSWKGGRDGGPGPCSGRGPGDGGR